MINGRVAVVGAGIIGLTAAYRLAQAAMDVVVIDRDPPGDKASIGNAGGIAVTEVVPASMPGVWRRAFGWAFDPLGPISVRPTYAIKLLPWLARFAQSGAPGEVRRISQALSEINSRVYEDLIPLLEEIGLISHLRRTGAIWLYETEKGVDGDTLDWELRRARHVDCEYLSAAQARSLEPQLGPLVCCAMLTPQWSYLSNPGHLLKALREQLLRRGVQIIAGNVRNVRSLSASSLSITVDAQTVHADYGVIAAGAWSAHIANLLGDRVLLESERGYNATLPDSGLALGRQLIFAERKFVATPLDCGLRIGGAAEFGGLDAAPNFNRAEVLVGLARRYLPNLRSTGSTLWAGHRPTTPDSLPVIGRASRCPNVFYAFGHGHLGLTQAATTARLIRELILCEPPSIDMQPYSVDRFS